MGNKDIQHILETEKVTKPTKGIKEYEKDGYSIAKPLPYFVLTETGKEQAKEVSIRMRMGGDAKKPDLQHLRTIGWYGPPGTGKDTLAKEIAICLNMPFVEFDLGHGTDILELIGGTGLKSENGATITSATEGPLTKAAKAGAIIAINEIVNVEGIQLSVIHAMVQDRKISLPSAEAFVEIQVHPDTFLVFTWNPDLRNPDRQMPPPALLDRLRARRFDADTSEDEAKKLVAYLNWALGKHVSIEAIYNDVKLIRELRSAYENGHLARCPYMRTLQDFALTRLNLGNEAAFSVLLNLCDQDPQEFRYQRDDVIQRHFVPIFGQV